MYLIPLYERPLQPWFHPQRLELFAPHGRQVMKYARHWLPGALRLLQSFLGHLDIELLIADSPLDCRDHPDVVFAWFSNCWETLSSPVISSW